MDDEAKQLLREIRDLLAKTIADNAESRAENATWKEEMRTRLRRTDKARRILAVVFLFGVVAVVIMLRIMMMGR